MNHLENKSHPETGQQLFFACALVGGAGLALFVTFRQPDRNPLIFAFALSWLISSFVGAFMGKLLLRLDPRWMPFALWEREGQFYERLGLGLF